MISRVEEIERRLEDMLDEMIALRQRLSAAFDRINQLGGGLGGLFGDSSSIALARAVGSISARSGTTLGSGSAHFATAPSGTLTEGADPTFTVKNLVNKTIADDSWLIIVKEPDWWFVVAVADCANLS